MFSIINKVVNTERAKVRRWIFVAWCIGVCCKRREEEVEGLFSFSPLPKPLSHDAYRTSKGDWEELSPSFFFFFAFAAALAAFQNSFQLRKELTLTDSYFVGNAHTKPNQYPYFQRDFLFKASLRNFFACLSYFANAQSQMNFHSVWKPPKFYHFEFWRQNSNDASPQCLKITKKVSFNIWLLDVWVWVGVLGPGL